MPWKAVQRSKWTANRSHCVSSGRPWSPALQYNWDQFISQRIHCKRAAGYSLMLPYLKCGPDWCFFLCYLTVIFLIKLPIRQIITISAAANTIKYCSVIGGLRAGLIVCSLHIKSLTGSEMKPPLLTNLALLLCSETEFKLHCLCCVRTTALSTYFGTESTLSLFQEKQRNHWNVYTLQC